MRNRRHGEPNLSVGSLIANNIYGSRDLEMDAVADVPSRKESSVADVAETDPHQSLPQGILKCWIGRLARRLAGRFRSGRPYAVKIATVTFRHRYSYLLWISRFISPVYHVASLEWLRQSSSRLIPAVCVRLQGPRSMRSCRRAIRWCLPRAKQAAGINLCTSDIRGTAACGLAWV
jgi:hypothetical protein